MEVAVRLNMPSALDSDDKDVVPGTPENHIAQHIVDDNIIAETSCASDTDGSNHTEPSLFSDEEGFLQSIFDYESLNHHENDIIPDSDPSENEDESEVELPSYDDFRRTLVHSDGIENVYVPEIEAIPESNYLENVIILETDSSESSEDEQHEDIDDEHQEEAASHLSDHSNDSLSDENQSNYSSNNEIIMETDLSESDDDSFQSNANIPLQNELDLVPETDFIENSEPEDEDDEIVSESSYTSEEEIVPNHASDDLLSQALQLPNAPNIFTEISENLHYNEVALENNELNNGEIPIGLISPNLFDDEVPISPEHLANEMPASEEESEEIPPTPFANERRFPIFVASTSEQPVILPQENENEQNGHSEQQIAAVVEEENPLDADDDETIFSVADENQSNHSSTNEIIMETDSSESDDDSVQSNANIPLQDELDLVPETDFIENIEPEDEDDVIVSESSFTSEEEFVPNQASDDLLSQALQLPNAPNMFTEISENLHYNEVALENNELNNGEIPIGLISPNLFDDEVPISPEHLANEMPASDEESEEIPPTPFANERRFPIFVASTSEQPVILPQENENEQNGYSEQQIAAVVEEENPLDADDDETIFSVADENQSNLSSINEIIMETDSSESDDDSVQSNANIPLQDELDLVPETDFIENSEPEDEDDVIVSESSFTSEEEFVPNQASDDLLSQALQLPNAPNIFTEISENLHYNEVALENNELNNGEIPIGLISPNLFDDEVPTELGLTSPEHLPNVMPVSDEETQEIPPTPFAYELVFPNFEPEQRAILPQENENGEQRMAAPVIEEENPLDSDDDETILTMADNPIVISAESSAIIERIENFIAVVMNNISNGCRIQVLVQNRSNWDNCYIENERFVLLPITNARCRRIRSAFNLSLIFYLLSEIHELLLSNRRCTVRELYYKNVLLTQKQQNVNEALKVVCCLLDATPWQLGVLSTSKGLIAGRLVIHLQDDSIIDCSMDRNGITLPHLTAGIVDLRTTAQHILLVEKDTVFKSLLQNNILERWNYTCILITGKGYPDMNTRLILSKLRELHSLPIDIVTDADPYGAEIMLTYRHGSLSMSNLAEELAVPSVRWLGIFPSDIRKFGIRAIPLTQEDKRKLDNILNRPFINDHVHRELLIMKQINLKAEIEGISEASATYLIDVYLRNKLDNNDRI